ncbi:MAG: outer membrane protein transport protein [Polyangiaceae bacterium]
MARTRILGGLATALLITAAFTPEARANGFDNVANGTEQFSRGGAWLARATDPLATFFNPAALSRNQTSASLSMNLIFQKSCFQRQGPNGTNVQVGSPSYNYGENCNSAGAFPNPQLAGSFRITDKLGIGIAVLGPAAAGKVNYGLTGSNTKALSPSQGAVKEGPAGTRYILDDRDTLVAWPQIGIGYEITKNFRVGASFIWGIAVLNFANVSLGLQGDQSKDKTTGIVKETGSSDVFARVKSKDLFVPGFTLSTMYTVGNNIDLAAWFHWSDAIHAKGEADIEAFTYDSRGNLSAAPNKTKTPTGKTDVDVPQPLEARIGGRFYMPRAGVAPSVNKDPLHDEQFDIEFDLEYSHDAAFDNLGIRFNGAPTQVTPAGAASPLGEVPPNADVPQNWKDSYGFRLGGDYNILPDRLAVRAGSWFQSSAVDPRYVHVDFVPAQRLALTVGATVRVSIVDIQVGYGHVFFRSIDNHGNGWLKGLSASKADGYRTDYAVNGGKLTASTNVASLGFVGRF